MGNNSITPMPKSLKQISIENKIKINKENEIKYNLYVEKLKDFYQLIFTELSLNKNIELTQKIYTYLVELGNYDKKFDIIKYVIDSKNNNCFIEINNYNIDFIEIEEIINLIIYMYNKDIEINSLKITNDESFLKSLILQSNIIRKDDKIIFSIYICFDEY